MCGCMCVCVVCVCMCVCLLKGGEGETITIRLNFFQDYVLAYNQNRMLKHLCGLIIFFLNFLTSHDY